jgi:hypothetical protein
MKISLFSFVLLIALLTNCEGDEGPAGINSLITTTNEPVGANCAAGGLKIEIGPDSNANGVLNADEIQATQFICNGASGKNSLAKTSPATVNDCVDGGIIMDIGVDADGSGQLDPGEIQSTRIICNGKNAVTVDQVRFQLLSLSAMGTSSTTGELSPAWTHLIKFSKSDFSALQSASLFAYISTETSSPGSITTVELFNVTDDVPITGSDLSTSSATRVWVTSGNFLSNIPDKEIEIALRLRTNGPGQSATCIQAYLILSKN